MKGLVTSVVSKQRLLELFSLGHETFLCCFIQETLNDSYLRRFERFLVKQKILINVVTDTIGVKYFSDTQRCDDEMARTFRLMVLEAFLDEQGIT